MIENKVKNPSIFSAVLKIKSLLNPREKGQWLLIAGFALCVSFLEMITASVIVLFSQVLNQPASGNQYLYKIGFEKQFPPSMIVLTMAILVAIIYLFKNVIAFLEITYQNFSIQKMNYHFKNKLLYHYANMDYGSYLTRNSAVPLAIVGGDAELIFSNGMVPLANILSESIIFLVLISMIIVMNPALAFTIFVSGFIIGLVVAKGLLPQFYRWGERLQEASLYSNQHLLQFFHAFKEILLFGKRQKFIDNYRFHSYKRSRAQAMQTIANTSPRIVIEVLFVFLFVLIIAFLCLKHESPMQMLGTLGGYLYVGFRVMPGLNRIITQLNIFKASIPAIQRIYDEHNIITMQKNYYDIPEFVFKSAIQLKNVHYRYPNTKK